MDTAFLWTWWRLAIGCGLMWTAVAVAHDGHESDLRHWETASRDPDRIVLTFNGDPALEMAVTWRTSTEVERGVVQLAPATDHPGFTWESRNIQAETEKLDLNQAYHNSQGVVHYHSAKLENLLPDTLYAYRVGDGGDYWSEWIHFRTASEKPEPFSFLYFGDAQNGVLSHWSRIIRAAHLKAPEARLMIHAGDLINNAHADREWGEWFKAGGWIHASLGSVVVPGNHEYRPMSDARGSPKALALQWRPQFNLPVEESLSPELQETVYHVDYQGVRLIVLNSSHGLEEQVEWVESLLRDNSNRWTILTFHHPVFSSGKGRDREDWRDLMKPILDRYGVDLVLQGHDHTYARGHVPARMVDADDPAVDDTITTVYVNSVSGEKMYEFMEDGWDVYAPYGVKLDRLAEDIQFFQVIRVEDDQLKYEAYTATGQLYDSFAIVKEADGSKRLTSSK